MKGELSKKNREFLVELDRRAVELGFDTFDRYFSNRLSYSLLEIAEELGISYKAISVFCKYYYQYKKQMCAVFSIEDFKSLFGEGDESKPSSNKGREHRIGG